MALLLPRAPHLFSAMSRVNLKDFPQLVIDSNDVFSSWRSWLTEFRLCIEMAEMNMGTERVIIDHEEQVVNVFRGRRKLVALLSSIGKDGRQTLQSLGFDFEGEQATYERALDLLTGVYGVEETVYVKTMKFVTVSQAVGENETDYLLRVENLSRKLNFGDDARRQEFALAIAVNGLRESSLRTQLMQRHDLDWATLSTTLGARRLARQSEAVLEGARASMVNVKQEIAAVGASSSNKGASRSGDRSESTDSVEYDDVNRVSSRKFRDHKRDRYSGERRRSDRKSRTYDRYQRSTSRSSRDSSEGDWRSRRYDGKKYFKDERYDGKKYFKDEKCFGCGKRGHEIRYCPEVRCFYCGKKGHTLKDCKGRKKKYGSDSSDTDDSRSGRKGKSGRKRSPFSVRYADSSSAS